MFTDEVSEAVGLRQQDWTFWDSSSPTSIISQVRAGGPGTRGIVYGGRGSVSEPEVGHFFNVINQGVDVRFLDGQTGQLVTEFDFDWFGFLRTNP